MSNYDRDLDRALRHATAKQADAALRQSLAEMRQAEQEALALCKALSRRESEQPREDATEEVLFRFCPLDLARYELLIRQIRDMWAGRPHVSREDLLLMGLDQLIQSENPDNRA